MSATLQCHGLPVKDPVTDARPRILSLVLSLVPILLDLSDKTLGVIRGYILGLYSLLLEVGAELSGVPITVWLRDLGLPVILDRSLELGPIVWGRVWDVVVGQPSLKLGLVPFIVDCRNIDRQQNVCKLVRQVI